MGGLGNQLFQYATGRALSARLGAELVLDDSLLGRRDSGITFRTYALGDFPVRARRAELYEERMIQRRVGFPWRYLHDFRVLSSPYSYYRERCFQYDEAINRISAPVILEGYWQSERYFGEIVDKLREELQPVVPLHHSLQPFFEQICERNSVSLHVRRGDYLSVAGSAVHEVCGLDYYRSAARFVAERVPNPVFFIFSDEPHWVAENLRLDFPTVVVSQSDALPAYEDLRLMSCCAHNIIANSSFSWWGAWLNPKPYKVVVAPARWFRLEQSTVDLIPGKWHQL
jgi:hypothetical protein